MPKKSKQERIEEKKAKRREDELKTKSQEEPKVPAALTAEEKLEEKRRAEEAQRTSDLQNAMELFGGTVQCLFYCWVFCVVQGSLFSTILWYSVWLVC